MARQAKRKLNHELIPWRLYVVVGFVLLLFCSLIARAAYIQIIEPDIKYVFYLDPPSSSDGCLLN